VGAVKSGSSHRRGFIKFFQDDNGERLYDRIGRLPRTLYWDGDAVVILDQTRLPHREVYIRCKTYRQVARAIRNMNIRGAPAIGVAAALGIALGCRGIRTKNPRVFRNRFERICQAMAQTRPTAVNLFWSIQRMRKVIDSCEGFILRDVGSRLLVEAQNILKEDIRINLQIGANGAELIPRGASVLTHCNTGSLATAGYGTALGVICTAWERGNPLKVMVGETRPFLQGARLTTWELARAGIPHTLITDSMAGHFMQKDELQLVLVGADRIALNGDAANKIGTYTLSVLAREHGIPFYLAAPTSTIDPAIPSGDRIPIEERDPCEVTHILGKTVAPRETPARNPAFDVTPARNITAIITERGVFRPPFEKALRAI